MQSCLPIGLAVLFLGLGTAQPSPCNTDQLEEEEQEVVARTAAETRRVQPRRDLEFRHHFVSLDLPSDRGQGDYGLTALTDLDREGDLDFVCGGRIPRPERLY